MEAECRARYQACMAEEYSTRARCSVELNSCLRNARRNLPFYRRWWRSWWS